MNRIKEVFKDRGISKTWLANKMEKSYNTINEYARNVRQPSLEDLYRIAEILDVDIKVLIVSNKK
ncbi:MAG TPA: helix-turn-helix transcriptional regulator [Bacteroidales bacterium]|nr:helix-turn-helix transcriptional regulator [Bacteroidales bacterium]HZK22723.1 helix-turn-helix transcriptional regulator [Atopostipes sp.]